MLDDDWFQERKSDFFQENFFPGRKIDFSTVETLVARGEVVVPQFTRDLSNTSPWITVIYGSQFCAERASKELPKYGLNIYYPKCRNVAKEITIEWDATRPKRKSKEDHGSRFVPAYGRYLFLQLPEDQETFANLDISEEFLAGPADENGFVNILCVDGNYSLTLHKEIETNRKFHDQRNKDTDPRFALRFQANEVVRVTDGNLKGYYVKVEVDIRMNFSLKSKTAVILGKTNARHYVKLGYLEKV